MAEVIIKTKSDIKEVVRKLFKLPLLRKSGKPVWWRFNIVQYRESRSIDQNRLMWKWWQDLEDMSGEPKEIYHEGFKDLFCPEKTVNWFGKPIPRKSTTLLNTKEFSQYLETVHKHLFSTYGIALEFPPETRYDEMI